MTDWPATETGQRVCGAAFSCADSDVILNCPGQFLQVLALTPIGDVVAVFDGVLKVELT